MSSLGGKNHKGLKLPANWLRTLTNEVIGLSFLSGNCHLTTSSWRFQYRNHLHGWLKLESSSYHFAANLTCEKNVQWDIAICSSMQNAKTQNSSQKPTIHPAPPGIEATKRTNLPTNIWRLDYKDEHLSVYPLVNWHKYGKSPFLIGNSTINGPFSLAMWSSGN